jgi:hypothetical protein
MALALASHAVGDEARAVPVPGGDRGARHGSVSPLRRHMPAQWSSPLTSYISVYGPVYLAYIIRLIQLVFSVETIFFS